MNLYKYLYFVIVILFLFSCKQENKQLFPDPHIKLGMAKISGRISNYKPIKENEEQPLIKLSFPNPVLSEMNKFQSILNFDGSFHFEIPIQCDKAIGALYSNVINGNSILVGLSTNKETTLEISLDDQGYPTVKETSWMQLTGQDFTGWWDVYYAMQMPDTLARSLKVQRYKFPPKEYAQYIIKNNLERRLSWVKADTTVSESVMTFVMNEFRMSFVSDVFLEYKNSILANYQVTKSEEEPKEFTPQEPDMAYYSFLKYFELNNSKYLYNYEYCRVLQTILSDKTLAIPAIGETPIDNWLKEVRTIMSDLVGFSSGLFYELLVSNVYIKQFNEEIRPLTQKQKENLQKYPFKNKDIVKILLAKNEEVIEQEKRKQPVVINETPAVSKENLINAIVSKYKGKVVVIDFWATWCAPCLLAMKNIKPVKYAMFDKNVVFVYITSTSSPKDLWEQKIKTIDGEHYYITEDEWNYLLDSFKIEGIPSYLYYDPKGEFKCRVIGINTGKMKDIIEELLPS